MRNEVIAKLRADVADFELRIAAASRAAGLSAFEQARLSEIEQRRRIRRCELVSVLDFGALDFVIGGLVVDRDSLPSMFTRDIGDRERLDALVEELSGIFQARMATVMERIKLGLEPQDIPPSRS